MLVARRFDNRTAKIFWRTNADDVVDSALVAPAAPSGEQPRQSIGKTVFVGRDDDTTGRSGHPLHHFQDKRTRNRVRFTGTTPSHYHSSVRANQLRQPLRTVKVYLFK